MMSAAVSTSRATSRTSKDKSKVTAHHTQTKTDGPAAKAQIKPTEEQMRLAQMTSRQDDGELAAIKQLMDMTGKSEDTVAVALHDCENDMEMAALMLLEQGQIDSPQGEWIESGKKKKRTNVAGSSSKAEPMSNHVSDRSENKRDRDRSRDDDRPDNKHDAPPRRGRRNGGPPPRLARGRGRERNNQFGDRNADGDHRDRGQEGDGFRDHDHFHDKENGFDRGFGRERSGERGRGRGRGSRGFPGRGGRGRGGSSGGGGFGKSDSRPQRFDKGPQIDTWTNETAENADKEPAGFGETWESTAVEDWSEDTWQGSLKDTKVFTASSVKEDPSPLNDITSAISQSNSLGQSGSMGQSGSLRQPGSIGSSSGLGPAPGMGQPSALGQRLDLGSLLKTAEQQQQQQQQASDNLIAQYNQQATESIKNTIGIGSTSRGNLSNLPTHSAASGMNSYSQSMQQGGMSPLSSQSPQLQQGLHQRSKPQRSKLPPPSKIPASAVEMPGHVMPQLDVQFGVDFGADSSSPFSFGGSEQHVTASGFSTTTQSAGSMNAVSMGNHLGQVSKSSESVMSAMSSPNKQPPNMVGLDHSPRTSVFQNTAYNTTPPKKDAPSPLAQQAKMTPPDPIPFPPSQSDMKSSPLMGSQRPGQTTSLAQGSLSAVKTDSSGLSSFGQSPGSYQSSNYQSHKTAGLSTTQAYTHTTSAQGNSYQTQYQPNQNQYQTGQNQYSAGTNQYQTGTNQYSSYQTGATSFQAQNSLYPSSTQTSSYQTQPGSAYQLRDSQSSSARQASVNSSNAYQNQASSLSSPPSQTQPSAVSGYSSKSYSASGLQTSPLTANKLGDSLSNMSIKDPMTDTHQASQFDHTTSTTAASLPTTTSTASLSSVVSTIASTVTSVASGSARTTLPSTTKAPPNLPPGVPVLGHQYIVGQSAMTPFYVSNPSQSIQQPLYPAGYAAEDMQLLQQRMPMANNYYDMSAFQVPSTIGQDRATLGSVPYSAGTTDSGKMNRVDAQSPNPTSQQQSTQSAHHPFINFPPYGYTTYYPHIVPAGTAAGFQYPTMFQMPPVTNTAHAGTTSTTQFQKSYSSHGYNTGKAYDDLTQAQDFTKTGYGASQTQTKGTAGTRTGTADLATSAYSKSHTQGFDKQQYHGGTPPPFNLQTMATQAGAMGAPTTPYHGAVPFAPMMPHQPHSQMLHHALQQDSSGGSARGQQASSQGKAASKPFTTYWGSN